VGVKVKFWKETWWIFINHEGRRAAKKIGDKSTALRIAQAIRGRIAEGDLELRHDSEQHLTLRSYVTSWLSTVKTTLKASSIRFYEGHLAQHILPALGERAVSRFAVAIAATWSLRAGRKA
jgi:integrase